MPDYSELFNRKNWLSWKQLRDKLKSQETLSDFEVYQLAWYIQESENIPLIIESWAICQKQIKNLSRLHFLIERRIVAIATGRELYNGKSIKDLRPEDLDESNEMISKMSR